MPLRIDLLIEAGAGGTLDGEIGNALTGSGHWLAYLIENVWLTERSSNTATIHALLTAGLPSLGVLSGHPKGGGRKFLIS